MTICLRSRPKVGVADGLLGFCEIVVALLAGRDASFSSLENGEAEHSCVPRPLLRTSRRVAGRVKRLDRGSIPPPASTVQVEPAGPLGDYFERGGRTKHD
jgi:hypothetical protein